MRYGLASDTLVRTHQDNAVKLLWTPSGGQASIGQLGLQKSGSAYVIPEDTTLLLMGTTSDLDGELRRVKGSGIDRFVTLTPRDTDLRFLSKVAARKWTTEGGGVGMPHQVTVIAVHSKLTTFEGGWRDIVDGRLNSDTVTIDELLRELPLIKERG